MFIPLSTAFFLLFSLLVKAENDWSTACVGSCAYETGDGTNTAWGSILIDGAPEVVSDISTAAGWSIMDCNSTSREEQVIRLVCHDPDAGCEQLFEGGAENTIVRLSADCADAPFARILNVTSSTNQTLTPDVADRVAKKRKRSSPPEVLTVAFDYNFHLLPPSRGTVSLTALATTNPLQRPLATAQKLRRALGYGDNGVLNARSGNSAGELVAREILRRDLFDDFISGNQIPPGTTASAFNTSNDIDTSSAKIASEKWSKTWNKQFNILNIQDSFPVIDTHIHCDQNGDIPGFDAKIKIDADVDVQATVSVGFIVAGTIIPPAITKAAFTSALDGGAKVDFKVNAVAQGSFNTGLLPFYSSGMAGLSIPGIIDVGPTFSINGQGIGNISVCTDAVIAANYQFPGLAMVFPPDQGPSTGQASQGDAPSPLSLSIGGSASLTGTVSAHIVPRVDLGVSLLSGMASASVFLELDGYGAMDMSLSLEQASTSTVQSTTSSSSIPSVAANEVFTTSSSSDSTSSTSTVSASTTPTPDPSPSSSEAVPTSTTSSLPAAANNLALPPVNDPSPSRVPEAKQDETCSRPRHRKQQRDLVVRQKRDESNVYSGCVAMQMGVKIAAGAQGKLFSFWKDSTSFDIFSHEWSILDKCFKSTSKRSLPPYRHGPIIPSRPLPSPPLRRDLVSKLVCPLVENAIADALTADNQIV